MFPSPDILNEFEHGKFVLSNLAAKRANQLKTGAIPLVRIESNHPLTIALAEIAAGKIKAIMLAVEEGIDDTPEMTLLPDEPLPAELGMLLPSLDEVELDGAIIDDEHDHDLDADETEEPVVVSLADLAGDEEEAPVASDEDTLSLTDVVEQENLEEETEE